jgi:hypothetical protein
MTDELYDDEFHVTYPAWVLVHEDDLIRTEAGTVKLKDTARWVTLVDDQGERAFPVFTDGDTAEAFCEAAGILDTETLAVADQQQLVGILRLIEAARAAVCVLFDPAGMLALHGESGRSAM